MVDALLFDARLALDLLDKPLSTIAALFARAVAHRRRKEADLGHGTRG